MVSTSFSTHFSEEGAHISLQPWTLLRRERAEEHDGPPRLDLRRQPRRAWKGPQARQNRDLYLPEQDGQSVV